MSKVMQVPKGWVIKELLELTSDKKNSIKVGPFGSQLKKEDVKPTGFKVYGQENVITDDFKLGDRFIDEEKFQDLKTSQLFPGDVVITMMGTGGQCRAVPDNIEIGIMDSHLMRIQCNDQIRNFYLARVLQDFTDVKRQIFQKSQGSIMEGLSAKVIKSLVIPVPSKQEQHRIAEILSTLDHAIEANEKLIAKEKQIKKGLMHDLLTHGIDDHGRIRTPRTHRYQESELGMIPEGWVSQTFKQASIELIDGDRGTNYPKDDDFFEHGYCLFLSAKNVTKTGFKFGITQFISKEKDAKLSKGKLSKNDIVLTTRGTVGNVAYYSSDIHYDNIRINSGMIILRNKNSNLLTSFLYLLLRSGMFMRQLEVTVFGSAQPQLTVKEIQKFIVKIPSLSEQKHITHIITVQDKKIENEEANLAKLKELKKGLMDDLLSGRVRVKE